MMSTPITLVCEMPAADSGRGWADPDYYRAFTDQLSEHVGHPVATVCGHLRDLLPLDGFILLSPLNHPVLSLAECPTAQQVDLASRLVAVNAGTTRIFEKILEKLSVAAAITEMSLLEWRTSDSGALGARGLHGRRDIGRQIGAHCLEIFSSERYCYLQSATHHGLPHLLADYLRALAQMNAEAQVIDRRP
jgi:hypothetical protein